MSNEEFMSRPRPSFGPTGESRSGSSKPKTTNKPDKKSLQTFLVIALCYGFIRAFWPSYRQIDIGSTEIWIAAVLPLAGDALVSAAYGFSIFELLMDYMSELKREKWLRWTRIAVYTFDWILDYTVLIPQFRATDSGGVHLDAGVQVIDLPPEVWAGVTALWYSIAVQMILIRAAFYIYENLDSFSETFVYTVTIAVDMFMALPRAVQAGRDTAQSSGVQFGRGEDAMIGNTFIFIALGIVVWYLIQQGVIDIAWTESLLSSTR